MSQVENLTLHYIHYHPHRVHVHGSDHGNHPSTLLPLPQFPLLINRIPPSRVLSIRRPVIHG